VLDAAHGSEGIERDRVARDQAIEEVAQGREGLVLGRRGALDLADILTGQARSDLAEFDALLVAPGEEPRHRAAVSAPGVGVVEGGLEKLLGGEDRVGASADQNVGNPLGQALELATLHSNDRLHTASAPSPIPPAVS